MITLEGIAIRTRSGGPMAPLTECEITPEAGIAGDFRRRPGRRQVTILSLESWQKACAETGEMLDWKTRRANFLITGYDFSPADVGRQVHIGTAVLEITVETDPCHKMEAACPGLLKALTPDWRGGVCCRVLKGGSVRNGDPVQIIG
ncbi:MAG: MOSC domain-containing protein [Pseudomonadales bacterium]|nr:MOSC domain-containing protein [Pseudomonadales bacterium]